MHVKHNSMVRKKALIHEVPMYKLAELMGISESTLMKRMRSEWSKEDQRAAVKLIEEYAKGSAK